MARVIQDSDDELDEEDLEKNEDQLRAPAAEDALSKQLDPTPQSGTGSTDSLKRKIEAAHRAHFQSQNDQAVASIPSQDVMSQSPSLPGHDGRRRKIDTDASSRHSSSSIFDVNKPLKTYGRSKNILSSPFLPQPFLENQGPGHNDWGLEGTIREDYSRHEPMAMFPEQSSTIENSTLTQQRLLAEVMHPAFLGIEADPVGDMSRPELAKSSIPWSDFIKSPSEDAEAQTTSATRSDHAEADHTTANEEDDASTSTSGKEAPAPASQAIRLSQRSRRESSVHLKGSPLRNVVRPEDIETCATPTKPSAKEDQFVDRPTSSHSSQASLSKKNAVKDSHSRVCSQSAEEIGSVTDSSGRPKKRKHQTAIEREEDLEDVGLPKEQYKPRQSRSRSLRADLEAPADYSVRPEKAAKRARRSKTLNKADTIGMSNTPQKVQQICEMGFSPSTTQKALRKNDGDVTRTVDWLVTNASVEMQDELAPSPTSRSRRNAKQSRSDSNIHAQAGDGLEREAKPIQESEVANSVATDPSDTIAVVDRRGAPHNITESCEPTSKSPNNSKVQVVIPQAKVTTIEDTGEKDTGGTMPPVIDVVVPTSNKKPKRRKTTLDVPESPAETPHPIALDPVKGKKRGRGRPRKEAIAPLTDATTVEEQGASHASPKVQQVEPASILQDTQPKVLPAEEAPESRVAEEEIKVTSTRKELPATTPPSNVTLDPPKPAKTPERQTRSATPASGLSKGKAPYRVGLSKRARIAPLLRVVKK